jgi:hypothetical protein
MSKHGHHETAKPAVDFSYPQPYPQSAAIPIEQEVVERIIAGVNDPVTYSTEEVEAKTSDPPPIIGNIDMCKLRDLLFSIRDNQIYCPICRCPEFSPNELRSSHFEPCSVGEMCERMLALYPRPEVTLKWRK